jgi:Carboxypeptidase regulatory-like domain
MHRCRAMLVLGLAMDLASAFGASPRSQQPVSPVVPVDPVAPVPPASDPSSSSKTGHAAKKHSHANDFLIIGTVFNQQSLAFPGAELRIRRIGENKFHWKTVTNSRGDFAVRVPQGASYEVVVSGKGFSDQAHNVDALHTGDTQQRISVRMEPAAGGKK